MSSTSSGKFPRVAIIFPQKYSCTKLFRVCGLATFILGIVSEEGHQTVNAFRRDSLQSLSIMSRNSESPVVKGLDEVLAEIPVGMYHVTLVTLAGLAYACDSLVANTIGFSSKCAGDEFSLTPEEIGTIPTALFAGAILGAIFFGQFADLFGRRPAMLLSIEIITSGFVITAIVSSYTFLVVGWFVIGIGAGGTGIAFDYITEVGSHASGAGFQVQCFWPVATTLVGLLAWLILGGGGSWRLLVVSLSVPTAAVWTLIYFYLPESARWHFDKGNYEEAEKTLRTYAGINGTHLEPFALSRGILAEDDGDDAYDTGIQEDASHVRSSASNPVDNEDFLAKGIKDFARAVKRSFVEFWRKVLLIFNDEMRGSTLAMAFIFWTSCFTFYGVTLLQARLLKEDATHTQGKCVFEFGQYLLSAPVELVGSVVVVFTIDLQGRRWSMATWSTLTALFFCLLGLDLNTTTRDIALLGARFSGWSFNVASWTPCTELFSTEFRATAFSFCYVMSRIGAIIGSKMVDSHLDVGMVSTVFAVLSVATIPVCFSVRETTGQAIL